MAFGGKVALVTGGGSGMGQRACERLAAAGVKVAAVDVDDEGLAKTATSSDLISTWVCDVIDLGHVRDVVAEVSAQLGPIDRVMAAAAIMPTAPLAEMDPVLVNKVMAINFDGVSNVALTTLPGMLERGRGDQVLFSSLMGFLPTMHFGAYCASKSAVRAFTEILYHENRESGVRFVGVAPPMVATPLLKQVTSDPKVMSEGKAPLSPDQVLDAVETALDKGKLWAMPGQAKGASIAARLIPNMIWKNMHKIEGV